MSQSSDNPVRQARRRGWAQKVLPPSAEHEREMREIARRMSHEEFAEVVTLWLDGAKAAYMGDTEALAFFSGTFGPWASELLRLRRS